MNWCIDLIPELIKFKTFSLNLELSRFGNFACSFLYEETVSFKLNHGSLREAKITIFPEGFTEGLQRF